MPAGFEEFWQAFPRRIGRLAAAKAYQKARTMATAEEIMLGVEAYIANKPDYADFCHPTTFLSQGRWMDEYHPAVSEQPTVESRKDCRHEPRCPSNVWHLVMLDKDEERRIASERQRFGAA